MNFRILLIGVAAAMACSACSANVSGGGLEARGGGGTSGQLGNGKDDGASKPAKRSAVYLVPVTPDLTKYSLFTDLEVDVKTAADGTVSFEYTIPVELTGAENKMEFIGAPNTGHGYEMPGASGKAVCDAGPVVGRCQMFYSKLRFDHGLRDSILIEKANGSADTLQSLKDVAAQFEALVADAADGRPHGILEILK